MQDSGIKIRSIAIFFLILMCVQYVPIEGHKVSLIKFGAMCLSPLIWMMYSPMVSKAFVWGLLYVLIVFFSALLNSDSFRISTIIYLLLFVLTFIMYYNLIYCNGAITIDQYVRILKGFILAYAGCLVLQQLVKIAGFNSFPLFNLIGGLNNSKLAANSLAMEPSHAARVMAVLFLGLLRMYEIKWGKGNVTIPSMYRDSKWVVLGFFWSMLTMGSGTAFIALGILSCYFIQKQYVFTIMPLFIIFYLAIPFIDSPPLQRAKIAIDATMTMDSEKVVEADGSAAVRIVPLINTLTKLDLTKKESWFGRGTDAGNNSGLFSEIKMVGGVSDYGLISYIVSLILVFSCCIRNIISLETLIFAFLLSAGIANVAYVWGILMIFSTVRYFEIQNIANYEE